jgi:hypothetical protein
MITSGIILSAIFQGGFKLLLALTAIMMVWVTLKFLDDNIDGDSFADTLKTANPPEKMYYFAARFLGVCILVGLAIS